MDSPDTAVKHSTCSWKTFIPKKFIKTNKYMALWCELIMGL